jgi:hypothetical protein
MPETLGRNTRFENNLLQAVAKMGNRAIKQPNGLYARFSEIVDDFTHANCSREELWLYYRDEGGINCANGKLQRADEDLKRFDEAIDIIARIHSKELAEARRKELSEPPQEIVEQNVA